MQYAGQTCRALQKRFGEHYRRMKKPKPIDTFLYQHFKCTGHSPNDVLVQPVEKLTLIKILLRDSKSSKDMKSKKISNDQELIQSDPISCPQNQKGNN